MRVSLNWLRNYVEIHISPEALAEKLTMAGLEVTSATSVDKNIIWEIEVTPNRTDCLSMLGIAREIAAITGKKLKLPKISSFRGKSSAVIPIQIQAKQLCSRYIGRVIKNVKVGPSPEWLIEHLEAVGIRSVNSIVDITNFCLLEFGQPLHAFDLDKLGGPQIIVRPATTGEKILTIDGVTRTLDRTMLVIADKVVAQAIAGIMGAKDSEVGETTTNILLESACFNPLNIHHTSRKLGLATQSSYRFERGVDLAGVYLASGRATELIQKFARRQGQKRRTAKKGAKGLTIGQLIDKGKRLTPHNSVRLRYAKANELLGAEIHPREMKKFLRAINFTIVRQSKEGLTVEAPSFRQDVTREADLIEEIARLYGYDNIPLRISQSAPNLWYGISKNEIPTTARRASFRAENRRKLSPKAIFLSYRGRPALASDEAYDFIRQILLSLGLNEIMSYSLISREALKKLEVASDNVISVKNPLSYEQEILRPTLVAGMLNALVTNLNRKNTSLKLFELSRVYCRGEHKAVNELINLCIGIAGKRSDDWLQKQGEYSFYHLKGIVGTLLEKLGVEDVRFVQGDAGYFTTGRCAAMLIGKDNYGFLGEIKKEILERFGLAFGVYAGEFALHKLLPLIRHGKKFVPLARFPSVTRDVSLVAPQGVLSEQIVVLIKRIGGDLVAKVVLFDQYFGEQIPQGSRALSFSIEYRAGERTLTAEEVDKLHTQVRRGLTEELGVQVR